MHRTWTRLALPLAAALWLGGTKAQAQSLELTVVDPVLECGSVDPHQPGCRGEGEARVLVQSNVAWELTIEDVGVPECSASGASPQGTGTRITMCNTSGRTGSYVLQLVWSSTCTHQLSSTTSATGNATPPGLPCAVAIDASTISELTFTDQAGEYRGDFVVTLSAM